MKQVVSRKIPLIKLIGADELDAYQKQVYLFARYQTDIDDFVICDSWPETILVNKTLSYAEDIVPIINKVMNQKYLNDRTGSLMDQFAELAGAKAGCTLASIWREWREKRNEAELKKSGEDILRRARRNHIAKYLRGRKDIIHTVFDIGFGLYSDDLKCDHDKGAENAFIYGYLCCMENNSIPVAEGN